MNYAFDLFLVALLVASIGWATYSLHVNRGPAWEPVFRAGVAFFLASFLLYLVFSSNYVLGATGLRRFAGSERIVGKDPISRFAYAGSQMKSNHLFALLVIIVSFAAGAVLIMTVRRVVDGIRSREWQQQPVQFWVSVLALGGAAIGAYYAFLVDTTLMVTRTAQMMYSAEYAGSGAAMPAPAELIRQHRTELGGYFLAMVVPWYWMMILIAEVCFASTKAHFNAACRELGAARAQAAAGGPPLAPAPAAVATPLATPIIVPPIPVVPFGGGGGHNGPAPGGAAPFIRRVPFNSGPVGRNGNQ